MSSGFSTSDTFSSLIDETTAALQGWGVNTDQVVSLAADISDTDTVFSVDEDNVVSRGIIEIDEELMWVQSSNAGQLTVPAWGRGWKGTAKQAHTAGSAVYVSPTYPRSIVSREVNSTIRALYPNLFAVGVYEFNVEPTTWQYEMPAEAEHVLDVEWRWDVIDGWHKLRGWELTTSASPTDYPTSGKVLSINEPLAAGVRLVVRYSKQPTLLTNPTDLYTLTGLPASSRDVVVYGAASRLLPMLDAGRTPVETVSADAQDQVKPVGNAITVARELRSLYARRLLEERSVLLDKYPLRQHKVR